MMKVGKQYEKKKKTEPVEKQTVNLQEDYLITLKLYPQTQFLSKALYRKT